MKPESTTGSPPTQERQRIAYGASLGNASAEMSEAGNFIWALGSLLMRIYDSDSPETPLPDGIIEGLAKGIRIVGANLMDEGAECARVLNKDWAAPPNADMQNRGGKVESVQ